MYTDYNLKIEFFVVNYPNVVYRSADPRSVSTNLYTKLKSLACNSLLPEKINNAISSVST